MNLKRSLYIILCLLLLLWGCKKESKTPQPVTPPPVKTTISFSIDNILQSNMVIQRNAPFKIWGNATPALKITIAVSWTTNTLTATANASGNWEISIPVGAATTTAQTITVTPEGKTAVKLNNILIGDVWICSGQSNMVMQVGPNATFQGVTDYQNEITAANYPQIRTLTLQTSYSTTPADSLLNPTQWTTCSPQTVGNTSAVAYYFAQKLNTDLNVPIGIIISAVNGTSCEAWINNAAFTANPYLVDYSTINNATQLYNGMINPLINLSVTGFIWYQGENNKNNDPVSDYTKLNSALIIGWRNMFNQGTLPFYLVQMTPFAQDYFDTTPVGGDITSNSYAKFREAQANVLVTPSTGMAITMDIGLPANQHPPDKKPVGERLALLALKNTYSQNVQCYGPQYASFSVNGNTVTIDFKTGTADGLNTINNAALNQYFYVAGNDHNFVQATAKINGDQIILTAPATLTSPVIAVRYAFTDAPVTNLQNSSGLPMEPFRTDNWTN